MIVKGSVNARGPCRFRQVFVSHMPLYYGVDVCIVGTSLLEFAMN